MSGPRLTEAEFEELKRKRDASLDAAIDEICADHGWQRDKMHVHVSGAGVCYCDCPDGPCQHEFEGWREFEDGRGGERVCKRCGLGAMSHDMRFMP